ncbi:ergothioneine biosynthesis glutamate--cysteine ligase EgtA [Luteipulveratus flavus]|uniref:Glutamate--cysteine ligase EgtA n=1 Tax=Luteipulveratus flavus TaxID=3031728 RepID=A0ABT6C367_9MICO|nr:ergothioneine biosynthesis glutamate--cysteine ligase EgtA [Luteipulveratus sp. YIM 133296]MDF8263302.1 ergothioneine biosynthesis glutamate--cysteine ligase EgtA [Luteipulveratus sp. YIM 133296]
MSTDDHLAQDPLHTGDPVDAARAYLVDTALTAGSVGRVGLELELHLVDHGRPASRPSWSQVQRLVADLPPMPSGSSVTVEPGGQLELSTPPLDDVVEAVAALSLDRAVLAASLHDGGFGCAPIGSDPARPPRRVNPATRYQAMERHFAGVGCVDAARAMMSSTAALQVNLDAGPEAEWEQRLDRVHLLGPVLIALSSTSPYLGGTTTGWHSMRQAAWQGLDPARTDRFPAAAPAQAWASYALAAPVMAVRDGEVATEVAGTVAFEDWLQGSGPVGRPPTLNDLDFHLTTLFPPVRPRGYLEIRYIDALPDRWWPAVAAVVATLMDDPVAADQVVDACEPVRDAWELAAREGTRDPLLLRAVRQCLDIAASRAPAALRGEVEELAELFASGRSPSSVLRGRIEAVGPVRALEEESR